MVVERGPIDGFWVNLGWGEWARATTAVFSGPKPNMIRWSAIIEKGASRRSRVMEPSGRIRESKKDDDGVLDDLVRLRLKFTCRNYQFNVQALC
jgi:hypothetical protein